MPYKDPEIAAAYNKVHSAVFYVANREKRLAQSRAWYAANKVRKVATGQIYRDANKPRKTETTKQWHDSNPGYALAASKQRKLALVRATPLWIDRAIIIQIYANCPAGFHVDHIIPLNGKTVSGLHVPENLQYLPAAENDRKGNKFDSSSTVPSESILQTAL